MELKEREQIVKDLQEIVDNYSGSWKRFNVLDNALSLIKELTEENERLSLEKKLLELDNDMLVSVTQNIKADTVRKMQDKLNERMDSTIHIFDFQISECNAIRQALRGVKNDIYQVAEELLEENNV